MPFSRVTSNIFDTPNVSIAVSASRCTMMETPPLKKNKTLDKMNKSTKKSKKNAHFKG